MSIFIVVFLKNKIPNLNKKTLSIKQSVYFWGKRVREEKIFLGRLKYCAVGRIEGKKYKGGHKYDRTGHDSASP